MSSNVCTPEIISALLQSLIPAILVLLGWLVTYWQNRKDRILEKKFENYSKIINYFSDAVAKFEDIDSEDKFSKSDIIRLTGMLTSGLLWADKNVKIKINQTVKKLDLMKDEEDIYLSDINIASLLYDLIEEMDINI